MKLFHYAFLIHIVLIRNSLSMIPNSKFQIPNSKGFVA
ncbi:hypothetical protein VIBHAR_05984 [Vibrio campbellii ATCC BAA-1116]|uniref:Uncharacterized protein n=1 Tax=Vibrio campbellii (strain ATCC BAA-1116) TaxID=2902295 RepID=A7N8F9_VIBC1|nr:hypothetical protein VIBHAR_05984 [Vibrio campbellii ATCC BAA-1116]